MKKKKKKREEPSVGSGAWYAENGLYLEGEKCYHCGSRYCVVYCTVKIDGVERRVPSCIDCEV